MPISLRTHLFYALAGLINPKVRLSNTDLNNILKMCRDEERLKYDHATEVKRLKSEHAAEIEELKRQWKVSDDATFDDNALEFEHIRSKIQHEQDAKVAAARQEVTDLRHELAIRESSLEIARLEIKALIDVVSRDRERVRAETAHFAARAASCLEPPRPEAGTA